MINSREIQPNSGEIDEAEIRNGHDYDTTCRLGSLANSYIAHSVLTIVVSDDSIIASQSNIRIWFSVNVLASDNK